MARYPKPMARLIEELVRLPGVGPKTAQRLAFFLISQTPAEVQSLTDSMLGETTHYLLFAVFPLDRGRPLSDLFKPETQQELYLCSGRTQRCDCHGTYQEF